jgi:hypothetical protein
MKSRNGIRKKGILATTYRDERTRGEWREVVQEYCFLSVRAERLSNQKWKL